MTGYRRVLTCGEPCAEDFECKDCLVKNGLSNGAFCTTVTGDTVCPDTLSVPVTAPAVVTKIFCVGDGCQTYVELPAVDVTVACERSETQNCTYLGTSGTTGTATYYPCPDDGDPFSMNFYVQVQISANYLIPFTDHQPIYPSPCTTEFCEGYVIGVFYSSTGSEQYGWATAYRGNTATGCTGSSRCYNLFGESTPVISSWVACDSTLCCDPIGYQAQNVAASCISNVGPTGAESCSLPTGFTIGRPV
jgi:hypothetical protein